MNSMVRVGRTEFQNPVLCASGTFGFGASFSRVANRVGGVVTKGITVEPKAGNPPPRIFEFPGGILNSVGLENPGLEDFVARVLPKLARLKCRLIVNVAGFTVDEYVRLAAELAQPRVDAIELNLSCPNVGPDGLAFGQSPRLVERVTKAARRRTTKTLVVKLTASFVDPAETGRAAEQGGADAVTVMNTLPGLALDRDGSPFLGGRSGGLSGPALKPLALYCVERVASRIGIPVIGCGGIVTGADALDFLSVGARLVQVGTASLVDPEAPLNVLRELAQCCRVNRTKSWEEVVGRTWRQE